MPFRWFTRRANRDCDSPVSPSYLTGLFDHLAETIELVSDLLGDFEAAGQSEVPLSMQAHNLSVLRLAWRLREEALGVCGIPPYGDSPRASDAVLEEAGFTTGFINGLVEVGPELGALITALEQPG